jgi:hypothetical protein
MMTSNQQKRVNRMEKAEGVEQKTYVLTNEIPGMEGTVVPASFFKEIMQEIAEMPREIVGKGNIGSVEKKTTKTD